MSIATILLKREEQEKLKGKVSKILEHYDNFALVEVTNEQIQSLQKEGFKVIVRNEIENIQLGPVTINTNSPRYSERGTILTHPAYEHTNDPGPEMHHYIVQFYGPIKEEWKDEIKKLGGILHDPLSSFAYIVEMNGQTRDKLIKLPFVRWCGHYDVSYRLSPELLQEVKEAQSAEAQPQATIKTEEPKGKSGLFKKISTVPNTFTVTFHTEQNMNQALPEIHALGATITTVPKSGKMLTVKFPLDMPQLVNKLKDLAAIHGVRSVDALHIMQRCNDVASRIMAGLLGSPDFNLPLTGEGEIIAVADTGLDTGDINTIHADFRGRITGIKSWKISPAYNNLINNPDGDDGISDVDSGHGTHVAGSVLGDGKKSQGAICGFARGAHLFFQAIEQKLNWQNETFKKQYGDGEDYLLAGLPDDLTPLFQQAYDAGARIHTNSWTGNPHYAGTYNERCMATDRFVWENRDMVILFAAGNYARDEDRAGKVNSGSITPPATAKNCISVGASENLREEFTDAYGDYELWNWDFPIDPMRSDKIADNPDDIAGFSGRGPCNDGRFKPDVVAPGTFILSTRSSLAKGKKSTGCRLLPDNNPRKDFYLYMHGTSMATPLTAGAVALIRQYLRQKGLNPRASLIKAALIHTALRKNYRYTAVSSSGLWDYEQGWGHVNLKPFISNHDSLKMEFIDGDGLKTGELKEYSFEVKDSKLPFKATLVYTDYPGNSVINNLNLIVSTPNGKDYHGNQFSPPFDSAFDSINNVETVYIPEPLTGQYKISVLANDVSEGPQDFSLVISGGFDSSGPSGPSEDNLGEIKGKVVYKSTKKSVVGAEISTDKGQSAITNSDGTYSLSKVPVGVRSITARKNGCKDASSKVTVKEGKVATRTLRLVC